jgi:hypothetical protein
MKDYSPERVATPEVRARHLTVGYLIAYKGASVKNFPSILPQSKTPMTMTSVQHDEPGLHVALGCVWWKALTSPVRHHTLLLS